MTTQPNPTETATFSTEQIDIAKQLDNAVIDAEVRGSQARILQFQALSSLREQELYKAIGFPSWTQYIVSRVPTMSEPTINEGVKIVRTFTAYDADVIASCGVEKLKTGLRMKDKQMVKTLDEVIDMCQKHSLSELREFLKSESTGDGSKTFLLDTGKYPEMFKERFDGVKKKYRIALQTSDGQAEPSDTQIIDFFLETNATLPQHWLNEQAAGRGGAFPGAEGEEGTTMGDIPLPELMAYIGNRAINEGTSIEDVVAAARTTLEQMEALKKDEEATKARQAKLDAQAEKERNKKVNSDINKLLKAKQGAIISLGNGDKVQLEDTFKDADGGTNHFGFFKSYEGENKLSIPENGGKYSLRTIAEETIVEIKAAPKQEKLIKDGDVPAKKGKKNQEASGEEAPTIGISKQQQAGKGKGGTKKASTKKAEPAPEQGTEELEEL